MPVATKETTSAYSEIISEWWASRRPKARGNIAGGLILLENLRADFDLDVSAHKASGSDQLRNATIAGVQRILARHGEKRTLVKEGGRTNRGLMKNLAELLRALSIGGMQNLPNAEREAAIEAMQAFLVEKAREALNAPKLSFEYRGGMTSGEIISAILAAAEEKGKAGEVAEYLVGAKLALRFPGYEIRNSAASAADEQTAEHGDFQINDSVFHVTVSPNKQHYDKCAHNLSNGLRAFLLVPGKEVSVTRGVADAQVKGGVSVEGIESFVSQNIEEMAEFAGERIPAGISDLLDMYNERVGSVESDAALLIKIPQALGKK